MSKPTDEDYEYAIQRDIDAQQEAYADQDADNKEFGRDHPADEDNPDDDSEDR